VKRKMLMRAQCDCIVLSNYEVDADGTFASALVVRDCCQWEYTLTQRSIRVDARKPVALTAEEEQKIWNDLRSLIVDGYQLRELRGLLRSVLAD
jgi:hypothetical protein